MKVLPILILLLGVYSASAQKCSSLERKANHAFRSERYAKAIKLYAAAIECNPKKEALLNRKIDRSAQRLARHNKKNTGDVRMITSKYGRASFNQVLVNQVIRKDTALAFAIAHYNLLKHSEEESVRQEYATISTYPGLWRKQKGVVTCVGHTGSVLDATFTPDGNVVMTAAFDSTARVWDLNGNEIFQYTNQAAKLHSIACSPDGTHLLEGGRDHFVMLAPWDTPEERKRLLDGAIVDSAPTVGMLVSPHFGEFTHEVDKRIPLVGHANTVNSVNFSADGKYMVTGSRDKTAIVWDMQGNIQQIIVGHDNYVWSAVFSPLSAGEQQILTSSSDKTARLWDVNGNQLQVFSGHESLVSSAIFSPDGKFVLTTSGDSTACLWNMKGEPVKLFVGHADAVWSAAFSPDGKYLVTGSWDKTARLWNVATGKLLQTFAGHTGPIYAVAFSPDGQRIVTASGDNTAKIWRIGKDCLECQQKKYSIAELRAAGVQLEPEDQKLR